MPTPSRNTGTEWLRQQAQKIGDGAVPSVNEETAAAAQVERWLQSYQVQYAPPTEIPLDLIDERRSRSNQARKDPLVPESVDRFALAMRKDAKFPPIVAYGIGSKLVIIDGNNRHAAAQRAGKDTIFGIIISSETPSELIQLLTVEANAHHGATPPLDWRLNQAFHLTSLGYTDEKAAEVCGLSKQQIAAARRVREADARARVLKIDRFTDIPMSSRGLLVVLKDDAIFSKAAQLIIRSGMTIDEVRDMNRRLKETSSEEERHRVIKLIEEEHGLQMQQRRAMAGKTSPRSPAAKAMLTAGIGMVLKVDEGTLKRAIVTPNDKKLVRERLKELEERLLLLQVAVDGIDVGDEDGE